VRFSYLACTSSCLRQGEVIENLPEVVPAVALGQPLDLSGNLELRVVRHPTAIVVSQDCDLHWDYEAREDRTDDHKLLAHVLFCDLFTEERIRSAHGLDSQLWRRVRQNQDRRYHHFEAGPVSGTPDTLTDLYADFNAVFSLPVEYCYALISDQALVRRGYLPSPYLEDFIDRVYHYLGRVAFRDLPDGA